MKTLLRALLPAGLLWLTACSTYLTPGPKADLQALAPSDIQEGFATRPTNPFPASIATVRIQASGYSNYNLQRNGGQYGTGRYSVITTREVEDQADLERITRLPEVAGVVAMNRLLLPERLESDREIRQAAARLHADLVLLYTFDTAFYDVDAAKPLTLITLGLAPSHSITAHTTASALLYDTRTGHIYSAYEASQSEETVATSWGSRDAADEARRATEKAAFRKLVDEFATSWPTLLVRAVKPGPPPATPLSDDHEPITATGPRGPID